eukprot:TRINITY_DN9740_c0_g1_i1.p1 TRINITY_DN9740_c0_g1~~TRINITY_DN9740_c0_g1_i1.p1  ORF type:complete len:496 (+),score=111.89 TRINITY_DN9740_c0_g1_i1:228-1715(+)
MQNTNRKTSTARKNAVATPHVICMVGLPARGKTYIAKKLARYLNWIGINTRVFNVGEYRRQATTAYRNHEFFRPENADAMALRTAVADAALKDTLEYLDREGDVAIFDATNTTRERRQIIYDTVVVKNQFKCLFLESICDNPQLIETNIIDVKVHSPDYDNMDKEKALSDFLQRIEHYNEVYVPMAEEHESHLSFMKVVNAGEKLIINRHEGNLQSRIVYWLMNIHITPRTIYLTRHGESMNNTVGKIGGDPDLSPKGSQYAAKLSEFINNQNIPGMRVWTSWLKRTIQTAAAIDAPQERWKALNEIDAGSCEELTYEEIADKFPEEFAARDLNKLTYRYPGGESYEDLVARLEPVIMELERQGNVVLIAHQAILRGILAYFMEKPLTELPYINVPLHTLIKITPVAYGCEVEHIKFPVDAVDTHRPRPSSPTHKRLRISSETAYELSDRTAAALSLGEGDTVVKTVGGPQFRLTSRDREVESWHNNIATKIEEK